MSLQEYIILAREYLTPKVTDIGGSNLYDTLLNIYSIKIVQVHLIVTISFIFLYFIIVGSLMGEKKKTIFRENFWVFFAGLVFMVFIFFGFIGLVNLLKG